MFLRPKDYRYQQHQISVDTTKNYLLLVNVSDLLPFSRLEYPFSLWKVSRECPQCAARTRSWEHPGTHSSWPPPQPSLSSVCLHNCRTSGFSKQQAQMYLFYGRVLRRQSFDQIRQTGTAPTGHQAQLLLSQSDWRLEMRAVEGFKNAYAKHRENIALAGRA